jgi:uncharacterized protein YbcV (DUF1398 family)
MKEEEKKFVWVNFGTDKEPFYDKCEHLGVNTYSVFTHEVTAHLVRKSDGEIVVVSKIYSHDEY